MTIISTSVSYTHLDVYKRQNHMFVSYVFYKEKLIDGDNFIYEARVRNSKQENAVPCSDIIMYIHSDTAMHGFATVSYTHLYPLKI